jgi:hypothetical protein
VVEEDGIEIYDLELKTFQTAEFIVEEKKKGQINNIWAQRPLEIRNNYSHSNKFGQRKKCKEGRAVFLIIKEHISLPKRWIIIFHTGI